MTSQINKFSYCFVQFLTIVMLESLLHMIFAVLLYVYNYSWNGLFIVMENTGESYFIRIFNSVTLIFLLRVIYFELFVKFLIFYFVKSSFLRFALNVILIFVFVMTINSLYSDESRMSEFTHPIWGWKYHLVLSVLISSVLVQLNFKKVYLKFKSKPNTSDEVIDSK